MRRLLGSAWHPDAAATFRAVCADARIRHGRFGMVIVVFAEVTDLIRAAVRARLGRTTPITGGHPPRRSRSSGSLMHQLRDDILGGWRRLLRQPRAALGAITLLALAIGVSSAMFTIVDAFIVRPAPYRDAQSLSNLRLQKGSTDLAAARAWRDSKAFVSVMPTLINAGGEYRDAGGGTVTLPGARVTPGTFADLGITPILGRDFIAGEGTDGNDDVVLLSEEAWRSTFAADPEIVGTAITISDRSLVVVGVMPRGLRFPIRGEGIWRPLDMDRPPAASPANQAFVFVRRQPGMPAQDAERIAGDILASQTGTKDVVVSRTVGSNIDDYSRESIISLAIGVGLVFILLCANVTNLILASTAARRPEFGVCTALGASRPRLLRQVLLENVAVGVVATLLGLGLAYGLVALARQTLPADLIWRTLNALDLDIRAVAATSAFGFLAVLLAGLPAAWFGTRTDVTQAIGQSRGGTDSTGSRRLTRGLLVVEVAMAVAVLASAGLHVRSFINLTNADRGIDADRVMVTTLSLPSAPGQSPSAASVLAADVEARLAALPGIERVNRTSGVPPDHGSLHFGLEIKTDAAGSAPVTTELMHSYDVGVGFFETFGIRIVDGRGFEASDNEHAVVLSETLARQLFADGPPVGRSISLWKSTKHIVGVAKEIRNSLTEPRQDYPEFYSFWSASAAPRTITLGVRCAAACPSPDNLREVITSVSAGINIRSILPLSNGFDTQLARPRTAAVVAAAFSGLALLATAAGLYGVLAYAVSRRRREFGIRAALGAHPSALRGLVLRDGLVVTGIGLVAGLGAGWALARWLESVQYGVTFLDPVTWSIVTATIVIVAMTAAWVPARSAMRVDPADMLREA